MKRSTAIGGGFISTDLGLTPEQIIQRYSRRFSIEEMFKELKETCGLGRQQTRKFESSLSCVAFVALSYIYAELATWNVPHEKLVKDRPAWDKKERRPSHKNRRDYCRVKLLPRLIKQRFKGAIPAKKINEIVRLIGIYNAA